MTFAARPQRGIFLSQIFVAFVVLLRNCLRLCVLASDSLGLVAVNKADLSEVYRGYIACLNRRYASYL